MRIFIATPLLLLAACNVSKDEGNGTTTVSFDQDAAENTLDTVGDQAQNIGGAIVNDVQETGAAVQDRAANIDVDVDTNTADNRN